MPLQPGFFQTAIRAGMEVCGWLDERPVGLDDLTRIEASLEQVLDEKMRGRSDPAFARMMGSVFYAAKLLTYEEKESEERVYALLSDMLADIRWMEEFYDIPANPSTQGVAEKVRNFIAKLVCHTNEVRFKDIPKRLLEAPAPA